MELFLIWYVDTSVIIIHKKTSALNDVLLPVYIYM